MMKIRESTLVDDGVAENKQNTTDFDSYSSSRIISWF